MFCLNLHYTLIAVLDNIVVIVKLLNVNDEKIEAGNTEITDISF